MNYKCKICDKTETCKKDKTRNTANCRLFIPNEEKELKAIKEKEEARKKLAKLKNRLFPFDFYINKYFYYKEVLDNE